MHKPAVAGILVIVAFSSAAFGHDPAGIPKNHCEDLTEWGVHDYGPPASGLVIFSGQDGNIGDCDGDNVAADFDGHIEFAFGGGWLSSYSGDGVTNGSIVCFGEIGHHAEWGPFTVIDNVLGSAAPFTVTSDTVNLVNPGSTPDCGDFESDNATECVGTCTVTFPSGLDGTYQVYVGDPLGGAAGVGGHLLGQGGGGGGPPPVLCNKAGGAGLTLEVTGAPDAWAEATISCGGNDVGNCRAIVPEGKAKETCSIHVNAPGELACRVNARGPAPPRIADAITVCA